MEWNENRNRIVLGSLTSLILGAGAYWTFTADSKPVPPPIDHLAAMSPPKGPDTPAARPNPLTSTQPAADTQPHVRPEPDRAPDSGGTIRKPNGPGRPVPPKPVRPAPAG